MSHPIFYMNNYITPTAQIAFERLLLNDPDSNCIRITSPPGGGFEIRSLFSKAYERDIIICNMPLVITDVLTMSQLVDESIDFSSSAEEFIIKRNPIDVVHTNT